MVTIVQAIYGSTAHFFPVHGESTLMTGDRAFTGTDRWDAMEKMLRWRAEKLNKGVGVVATNGDKVQDLTQDAPAVEDCTAPVST